VSRAGPSPSSATAGAGPPGEPLAGAADSAPQGSGGRAPQASHTLIDDFADLGVIALVTTRRTGSFSTHGTEAVGAVTTRWQELRAALGVAGPGGRFATASQVHGARVVEHQAGWEGWLRMEEADGHFSRAPGTGFGVTVADCVPVFLAHPSGATALLHAGWRGTAGRIVPRALEVFAAHGLAPAEVRAHLGPAICGRCYEVGPAVYSQLTGRAADRPTRIDLRAVLADQARAAGVRVIATSPWCTRCDNELFFSHRAGDVGRQVAALIALA
jgi:purine-nucleoside/S-methyl-5'-thioadenosine phosphorylase / adenosine deaminase